MGLFDKKANRGHNTAKGKQGFQETGTKIPEAPTPQIIRPTGKELFEAQLAKEHAKAQREQDIQDREKSDRLALKTIISAAEEEGTTYNGLRYSNDRDRITLGVLYNFNNWRSGGYYPASPIIYDKENQPIGYVYAWKSHIMQDSKLDNREKHYYEATYEIWIPKALWGNGYEMAALTKSMSLNPWDEPGYSDYNGIASKIYVNMDNADFSGELLANGWTIEHVDEYRKFRTFVRSDLKVIPRSTSIFSRKNRKEKS